MAFCRASCLLVIVPHITTARFVALCTKTVRALLARRNRSGAIATGVLELLCGSYRDAACPFFSANAAFTALPAWPPHRYRKQFSAISRR